MWHHTCNVMREGSENVWHGEGRVKKCVTPQGFLLLSTESPVDLLPNIWEAMLAPFLQNFQSNYVDSMSKPNICKTSKTSERRSTKFRCFLSTSNVEKSTEFSTLPPLSSILLEEFSNKTAIPWPGWAWLGFDGSGLHLKIQNVNFRTI